MESVEKAGSQVPYKNRQAAGRILAGHLRHVKGRKGLLVLGLPRGGVIVAAEVAAGLEAALDVIVVRKLGIPGYAEVAMGAIASGGAEYLNADIIDSLRITREQLERVRRAELKELKRRELAYRGERPPPAIAGRTLVLADDGIATGATIHAAVKALKKQKPAHLIAAVPVAPREAVNELSQILEELICPLIPESFAAVGQWYEQFPQTTDAEVRKALAGAWHRAQG